MKTFLGVDLGLKGGLALLDNNSRLLACEPMPTIEILVGKKKRNQYDIQEINNIIKRWISEDFVVMACFERLRPMPGQASQTGFSLGAGSMLFKTIFTLTGVPFMEVEARTWQKKVFEDLGIQYKKTKDEKKKATKIASIQAAKQLFPEFNFKASEKCRTDHDGMTDSSLIAYFLCNKKS